MKTSRITSDDDIDALVAMINEASWGSANDMCMFDVEGLRAYLEHPDTVFVVCYEDTSSKRVLLGFASSRFEMKPYGKEMWLYIDELDVCADQRQRGAGKLIMQTLIELASKAGCKEVWLGTEVENIAANALYQSLEPDEIAHVIGYTYETDNQRSG